MRTSKRTQTMLVALLRDSGMGLFATAGATWNVNSLKSLIGETGLEASTWQGDAQLRAAMIGRTVAALATVPILNMIAWGRPDGDDKTPLGAVKLGTRQDGTISFVPVASWLGIDRGLRLVGASAFLEGARTKRPIAHSADKAIADAAMGWAHPAMGPIPQMAYTALSGKNALGMRVAPKEGTGYEWEKKAGLAGCQEWQNLKASLKNVNPAVGAALAANRPQTGTPPPRTERAESLARPFVGQRKTAPGKDTGYFRR